MLTDNNSGFHKETVDGPGGVTAFDTHTQPGCQAWGFKACWLYKALHTKDTSVLCHTSSESVWTDEDTIVTLMALSFIADLSYMDIASRLAVKFICIYLFFLFVAGT